jgi:hypothetical protein
MSDPFEDKTERPTKRLLATRLSRVSVEPVHWLWPNRIPFGAVTLLAGEPDAGKTSIVVDMIARSTTGRDWPNDEGKAKHGSWIYFTTENDQVRTIKPRLSAAGGDVNLLTVVKGIEVNQRRKSKEQRGVDLMQDIAELETMIAEGTTDSDTIGIVFDPLSENLGPTVNSWKDSDVRRVLGPLVALAERRQVAIVGVMHPGKAEATTLLNKILGSVAFGATARTVLYLARDTEASDKGQEQFIFTVAKNNLGRKPTSLAYELPVTRIEATAGDDPNKVAQIGEMVFVRWLGATDRTAGDMVFPKEPDSGRAADHRDAVAWLMMRLGTDRVPVKVVEEDARAAGIKRAAFRFACEALNVRRERDSFGGAYLMSLPPREPGRGTPFGRHDADDGLI